MTLSFWTYSVEYASAMAYWVNDSLGLLSFENCNAISLFLRSGVNVFLVGCSTASTKLVALWRLASVMWRSFYTKHLSMETSVFKKYILFLCLPIKYRAKKNIQTVILWGKRGLTAKQLYPPLGGSKSVELWGWAFRVGWLWAYLLTYNVHNDHLHY